MRISRGRKAWLCDLLFVFCSTFSSEAQVTNIGTEAHGTVVMRPTRQLQPDGPFIYSNPTSSSDLNVSFSDNHTEFIGPDAYYPYLSNIDAQLSGRFNFDVDVETTSDGLTVSGQLNSFCSSLCTAGTQPGAFSAEAITDHNTLFTLTEPRLFRVTCNGAASPDASPVIGSLTLLQTGDLNYTLKTWFYMGHGAPNGGGPRPSVPTPMFGVLPAGNYRLEARGFSFANRDHSSSASINFEFEIAPLPTPEVTTLPASNITSTSAYLNCLINTNGNAVTARIEYGLYGLPTYSHSLEITDLEADFEPQQYSRAVTDLFPNALYRYRAIVQTANETIDGGEILFTPVDPVASDGIDPSSLDSPRFRPQDLFLDPVDMATGAFTAHHKWLNQNTTTGLAFDCEYSSNGLEKGPLGPGWGHSFEVFVEAVGTEEVIFNWTRQRRNTFRRVTPLPTPGVPNEMRTQVFYSKDAAMRHDLLEKKVDGTYALRRADQSRMYFTNSGRLSATVNQKGQTLNLSYSPAGLLTKVTDDVSGRAISYQYDAQNRIREASDALGRNVTFKYDALGALSMVALSDAEGETASSFAYSYDSEGRILTGSDGNGVRFVTNTYDGAGRVERQDDARRDNKLATFTYDDSTPGLRLARVRDRNGDLLVYTYDLSYRLLSLKNQNGETTSYTYDSDSNRTSTVDALGRAITFSYDERGHVTKIVDPTGAATVMAYDHRKNLVRIHPPIGNDTTFIYDARNNLTSVTNALSEAVSFAYDANSLQTRRVSPRGSIIEYAYTNGLPTTVKDANQLTTSMDYDAAGRLLIVTDPAGKTLAMSYNLNDDLLAVTDALGHITTFTYDKRHRKLSEANPLGQTSRWLYDGNGNVVSLSNALNKVTRFSYDGEDRLSVITDALGKKTKMGYDSAGRLVSTTDGAGKTRSLQRDSSGNITGQTDARGFAVKTAFDSRDLPVSSEDALNRISTSGYDIKRRVTQTANPMSQALTLDYDDLDRLIQVTDPLNQVTRQAFDGDGNRSSITNARNASTSFAFDLGNRLTSTTTAGGRVTSYSYDSRNLPATVVEPSNQTTTFTYDDARRLTGLADEVGPINYTYDEAGRLLTVVSGGKTISREYDADGRMTKFTDGDGNVLLYAFDAAGNLIKLTYPDGKTVKYAYDAANRLKRVSDWKGRTTKYAYDADGRLLSTIRPNKTVETRVWNEAGELAELVDSKAGVIISAFHFTRDPAGRIVAEHPEPTPGDFLPASFTAAYDSDNRLTMFNGAAVSYDADGNMTDGPVVNGSGNAAFTYDARNRLTSFGGVTYGYDAEDRRISLTDGTGSTHYVINPGAQLSQILVRIASDGKVTRAVYGLGLLYEETEGEIRYFHYDYRGSAVAFTNVDGIVIGRAEYGPYGELAATSGNSATPFLFNGKYGVVTDRNGLGYMRLRYYHSGIKRFVSQDVVLGSISVGIGMNRFGYANANPVSLIDPWGLAADEVSDELPNLFMPLPIGTVVQLEEPSLTPYSSGANFQPKAAGNSTEVSPYRYTMAGEEYVHYGYRQQARSFEGGLKAGGWATESNALSGVQAQRGLALKHTVPPDAYYRVSPEPGTLIRTGGNAPPRFDRPGGLPEFQFPRGTGPGTVSGPFLIRAPIVVEPLPIIRIPIVIP